MGSLSKLQTHARRPLSFELPDAYASSTVLSMGRSALLAVCLENEREALGDRRQGSEVMCWKEYRLPCGYVEACVSRLEQL